MSAEKKKIHKPSPISGFPEYLPEVRMAEQRWLDHIRRIFESYGFAPIETPAVEDLEVIRAKGGDADKEIYVLERLHKEEGDEREARLALHFDQTVPLARYTAQHFNDLTFPFKRYQMQKVWRGERPQAGRFREFTQCDIDVINVDHLPLHFDAEMPAIIWEVLTGLPEIKEGDIQLRISNRKILMGFLDSLDFTTQEGTTQKLTYELKTEIIRDIDKLEKLGEELTLKRIDHTCLSHGFGSQANKFIEPFIKICKQKYQTAEELEDALVNSKDIDTSNPTLREGIDDLAFVLNQLSHLPKNAVVADLSIVRGLDYYTGTVYETIFTADPGYGSICSGGRYDDLSESYINKKLPGVGISIGFSRLFDRLRQTSRFDFSRKSPADIFMVLPSEDRREITATTARTLRGRGFNVETAHGGKLKKQLAYAEKKGIPYVWFPPFEDGAPHEVKSMESGTQTRADPQSWQPEEPEE